MYVLSTWKERGLTPEQTNRLMTTWGKLEARMAESTAVERVCWFMYSDGSGGITVAKAIDVEAATQFQLETALALSEFLEIETRQVLDLDTAMPAILNAVELINA